MDVNILNDLNNKIDCDNKYDKFWLDSPSVLYTNDNYTRFFPKYEMTRREQLNSIARFGIYITLLIILFKQDSFLLFLSLGIIVLTVLIYKTKIFDNLWKNKVFQKIMNIRNDFKDNIEELQDIEFEQDNEINEPPSHRELLKEEREIKRDDYIVKSGKYDSDNNLNLGERQYPEERVEREDENLYSINEIIDYERNTCRRPTADNPLMNTPAIDYGNQDIPVACNANDDEIKDEIVTSFNKDLFRDIDELFDKENSQRQFYTVPNTAVPNNQRAFAESLYKLPTETICKEDQNACYRWEDLRVRTL